MLAYAKSTLVSVKILKPACSDETFFFRVGQMHELNKK